jgi:hypothetical protein
MEQLTMMMMMIDRTMVASMERPMDPTDPVKEKTHKRNQKVRVMKSSVMLASMKISRPDETMRQRQRTERAAPVGHPEIITKNASEPDEHSKQMLS